MNLDLHSNSVTYREIIRQQQGWRKAVGALKKDTDTLLALLETHRDRVWVFVGCGTSYYLAQTASFIFETLTGIRTMAMPASEILLYPDNVFNPSDTYLMIPISRSGTTTETVRAAEKTRDQCHIPTLAVSCAPGSPLSVESDLRLTFPFETERSVVMTGSFTTMLLSIVFLGALDSRNTFHPDYFSELAEASHVGMNRHETLIKELIFQGKYDDFVFLGQGAMLGIANEAALKMQEMTISNSLGFHSLEYRHGPMSTAGERTLISILSNPTSSVFDRPLAKDLYKLGSGILMFRSDESGQLHDAVDYQLQIGEDFDELVNAFFYMPLLQLLSYYRAIQKNINPDKPKNLSQVVHIEI